MNIQLSPIVEQPDIGSGIVSRQPSDRRASFEHALDRASTRERSDEQPGAGDLRPEARDPEVPRRDDVDDDRERDEQHAEKDDGADAREDQRDGEARADEARDDAADDEAEVVEDAQVVVPVVTAAPEAAGTGKARKTDGAQAIGDGNSARQVDSDARGGATQPLPGAPVAATATTGGGAQGSGAQQAGGENFLDAALRDTITANKAGAETRSPSGDEARVMAAQEAGASKSADSVKRPDAPPPPRQLDPRLLRLAEANKDSVLRQIAVHLTGSGGEMHLHLDPPELGAIEMQLTDKNGVLRLQIYTDRPEMNNLIERHIDDLRQSLAEQGLSLAEAHVEARDRGERGDTEDGAGARADGDDSEQNDTAQHAHHGYITAEGLDFYV